MLGEVVVWFLKWYYFSVELWMAMYNVLKIKFKTPKTILNRNVIRGHLAIRLNDTKVTSSNELVELMKYVHSVFGVKYLTVISGAKGFEKEIELSKQMDGITFNIYHNFEPVFNDRDSQSINVNLIDDDSQNLFLLKLKEQSTVQDSFEDVLKLTLSSFTNFPPIDLYLCMTRDLNFTRLYPLHLSFTQFYCCPVLADQSFSKEAITEGFELFGRTKQNFGR